MGLSKPKNVLYGGGGLEMELLWENASPTSGFSAQTLNLDLSEYEYIVVLCTAASTAIGFIGSSTVIQQPEGKNYLRRIEIKSDGIDFYDTYRYETYGTGATVVASDACIPYRIFGIKGVSK